MRSSLLLFASLTGAGIIAACGSSDGSSFGPGGASSGTTSNGGPGPIGGGDGGSSGEVQDERLDIDQASLRIEPADAVLTVEAGKQVTQAYRIFGKTRASTAEEDLTTRFVFYVPDNFLVGGFPREGGPLFTSRLPTSATDYPQRAGRVTVQARARNSGDEVRLTTSLTVKMNATLESPNTFPSIPSDSKTLFEGPASNSRKPVLVYPNDGTMLPPNLRRLEVHWKPGSNLNKVYEIRFTGANADIVYYSRCSGEESLPADQRKYFDGACAFELDGTGYGYLAESNRGTGPVKLRIRATDDEGTGVGASDEFTIEFAENRVDGGLYYWQTTGNVGIMRFDFGAPSGDPEEFLTTATNPTEINQCAGCHALSRNGQKLVASLGGQNDGRLVYINDLAKQKSDPSWLTVKPNTEGGYQNRIQFASFNPESTKFVAVYGDEATAGGGSKPPEVDSQRNFLFFHDGNTGLRVNSKELPFKPNHPDWSPNGNFIAITHVDEPPRTTTQRPKDGSIDVLQRNDADPSGFGPPVNIVAKRPGFNRFNPNFVPDSSFLYFTESDCSAPDGDPCDGDADLSATTWVTTPLVGGKLIHLANSAKPGVQDSGTMLGDTFPRSAPFQTVHRSGKLFWFTVASRRTYGLRKLGGAQHLWMFAVDPAKIAAGEDGSFTGFYLPFQNDSRSNHIGQWTERIVGGAQPPPEPPPVAPEPPDLPPVIK